jgi:DNA polymerase-3 subunit delta
MAKIIPTYDSIIRDLQQKKYYPIYFLMGEEGYFIDKIADYIIDHVLTETEKDFNLTVTYGSDVADVAAIINLAKRYPMMASHQVVVVKEAQNIDNLDELALYLQKPQPSTILVICHKNGTIDRRKKLAVAVENTGILYESKKWWDNQLPTFINSYLSEKNIRIEPKAAEMMSDFIGSDLSRMSSELDKLIITLDKNSNIITSDHVEKNIGISKDYNNYELLSAIQCKDVLKANAIIRYFAENPKMNPIQITIATLFNFFSNMMLAYYAPDKSQNGIANFIGIKSFKTTKSLVGAMHYYNAWKTMQIISEIRRADAMSKDVDSNSTSNGDILKELIFKILH